MLPALPEATLLPLAYTVAGCALGTASGLLPGLHANNFALVLAATAPALDAPPLALGCAMLAAGLVHTFLDVVPALALGVPDAAMAASALPGHRLVIATRKSAHTPHACCHIDHSRNGEHTATPSGPHRPAQPPPRPGDSRPG